MKLFDGAKLKQMRLDAKLTQYDLAPLTNITQTRISDIERNVRQPLPKEVDAFMAVFGKTTADFLSDERERESLSLAHSQRLKRMESHHIHLDF